MSSGNNILLWVLTSALFVAILGLLLLAYLCIDNAISYGYLEDSLRLTQKNSQTITILLEQEWIGMDAKSLIIELENAKFINSDFGRKLEIDSEDDSIWLDDIQFVIKAGKLEDIVF